MTRIPSGPSFVTTQKFGARKDPVQPGAGQPAEKPATTTAAYREKKPGLLTQLKGLGIAALSMFSFLGKGDVQPEAPTVKSDPPYGTKPKAKLNGPELLEGHH